jgi:hypothetical protein
MLSIAAVCRGGNSAAGAAVSSSYLGGILPGFALVGSGVGLSFAAISVSAMVDATRDQAGLARGY